MQTEMLALHDESCIYFLVYFVIKSRDSCVAGMVGTGKLMVEHRP